MFLKTRTTKTARKLPLMRQFSRGFYLVAAVMAMLLFATAPADASFVLRMDDGVGADGYRFRGTRCIGGWQGGSLLRVFCAYQSYLYYSAT